MTQLNDSVKIPVPLVAAAGWLVPGAGYWLIGEKTRAVVVFTAILVLYLSGVLVAGVRVIEVPGYDSVTGEQIRIMQGRRVSPLDRNYPNAKWIITGGGLMSEIAAKPWFVGQVLAGPLSLTHSAVAVNLAQKGYDTTRREQVDYPRPHAPLETVGTLYTALAGMLSLFVIIDSSYRASQRSEPS